MKDYSFLMFAALLLAVDFALNKLYQKQAGTSVRAGFGFNALLGLFTAVVFWGMSGFSFAFTPYSFFMAGLLSLFAILYTLLGFRILKAESMALYTLFLMTGGMALPYVWGLLFLKEPFSLLRTVGLLLIVVAVVLSNIGIQKKQLRVLPLCIAVFFLNGLVSILSKLHQTEVAFATVNATQFVMLSGLFKFLLAGTLFLFCVLRERKQTTATPSPKKVPLLLIILSSAVVGGVSYALQLVGAASLPATVLYPFITGGGMLLSSLTGILLFREKPSKAVIISILLCFLGTILFL